METYNYLQAVTEDVKQYIQDNGINTKETSAEELEETLWTEDSVTGNASGSYTFNTWKAEEYLCHNMDLLAEALEEFGYESIGEYLEKGAEACDVTIRCYLLPQAIAAAYESAED